MRLSCGLRMLLKLQATPMLSFSSELKNNEKQKLASGGRAAAAGHTTKFHFFGLTLGNSSPYAPAHSFARTHARNATATETEIDFPVGNTPQPPMPWYDLIQDAIMCYLRCAPKYCVLSTHT